MRWTPGGVSDDVEDRRDDSGGGGGSGFGGFGGIHLGVGGTIVLLILSFVFKQNLFSVFSGGPAAPLQGVQPAPDRARDDAEKPQVEFVSFVLDDVQRTWEKLLPAQTRVNYRHAKLVLYRNSYPSACGEAQTATGPFYCPGDEKVYLDLGFFDELSRRFGAPGQFAQAYVIAHELGHHVQKLLGIEARIRRLSQQRPDEANPLSVRLELQADCFAGVWGHSTEQRNLVDANDINQGLRAAASVGDDRLQKMSTGQVSPETFTHGSSAQRTHWFHEGLDSGSAASCNTIPIPQAR